MGRGEADKKSSARETDFVGACVFVWRLVGGGGGGGGGGSWVVVVEGGGE